MKVERTVPAHALKPADSRGARLSSAVEHRFRKAGSGFNSEAAFHHHLVADAARLAESISKEAPYACCCNSARIRHRGRRWSSRFRSGKGIQGGALTRQKLKQKFRRFKDIGTKACTKKSRLRDGKPVNIKIDNTTGVSNNTKLTYKAKDKTVEQILNK